MPRQVPGHIERAHIDQLVVPAEVKEDLRRREELPEGIGPQGRPEYVGCQRGAESIEQKRGQRVLLPPHEKDPANENPGKGSKEPERRAQPKDDARRYDPQKPTPRWMTP